MIARWEHFHHGADIGVPRVGDTLREAFEQAALALTAIVAVRAAVRRLETATVSCEAPDRELLLVHWLNAVIYEMAAHDALCTL